LRYLRQGDGGDAVLLIHGFGGDLNNWLFNHQALASDHIVYALDLPGHGGSSKRLASGSLQEFVQMVQGFLAAVDVPRAHLVGHSMGGAVAIEFAFAHPQSTLSLTLIASAGLGPEINSEYINGFIAADRRKEMKPVLDLLFANPGLVTRQLVEDLLKYKRLDGVETSLSAIASELWPGGRQVISLRDRLNGLSIPVLVVWGAEDRILPVSHAQGLSKSVEILAHCGHMAQMEAAAKVNQIIHSFWDSLTS
jgi:pyruvate dehydrogenase E2 component (dihydrolipoamide acetyltransferase)